MNRIFLQDPKQDLGKRRVNWEVTKFKTYRTV